VSDRCGAFPDPYAVPVELSGSGLVTCSREPGHPPPHGVGYLATIDFGPGYTVREARRFEWRDPPFVEGLPEGVRARVERVVPPVCERAAGWLRRLAARLDP
jgi:hypothetical protein